MNDNRAETTPENLLDYLYEQTKLIVAMSTQAHRMEDKLDKMQRELVALKERPLYEK